MMAWLFRLFGSRVLIWALTAAGIITALAGAWAWVWNMAQSSYQARVAREIVRTERRWRDQARHIEQLSAQELQAVAEGLRRDYRAAEQARAGLKDGRIDQADIEAINRIGE